MPTIAGGNEIGSDVPYSNTSNVIASEVVDDNAALKGAAGVIIPAVEDAYRAAQDNELSGGNSVEDVFKKAGSEKPEESELTDLTKISQAFADGHIGRQDAQMKVLQLVKQAGVNNPGEASKFRKEAARFFQGAFGGGPNPFGSLSADEKAKSALQLQLQKHYLTKGIEMGVADAALRNDEMGAQFRVLIDDNEAQAYETQRIQAKAARINARTDYSEAERNEVTAEYHREKEDDVNKYIDRTNDMINLLVDKASSAGPLTDEARLQLTQAIDNAMIRTEAYINDAQIPFDAETKTKLLSRMSHFTKFKQQISGEAETSLREAQIALQKSRSEQRIGKTMGFDLYHLMQNKSFMETLTLAATKQPRGAAMQTLIKIGNAVSTAIKGQIDPNNSNPGVDLPALRLFTEEQRAQEETGTSDLPKAEVETAVTTLVERLAGRNQLPNGDELDALKQWDEGLITLRDITRSNGRGPTKLLGEALRQNKDLLVKRINKEYTQPLSKAAVELFQSRSVSDVDGIEIPSSEFIRLVPHEDGIKAEIIPERQEELSAMDHEAMSQIVTTFNTKFNNRFRNAIDTAHRMNTGNYMEDAPISHFTAFANKLSESMGLDEPAKVSFDTTELETTEKLTKLQDLEKLQGSRKIETAKFLRDTNTEIRRTKVTRDPETGKVKTANVRRSSTADAAERASAYLKGDTNDHPYGEVTTGPGAITYVFQAKPELFKQIGISQNYLEKLAIVESGMNPSIKAKTSSATGLFQFVDKTWNSLVQRYGDRHGISGDMRTDPVASALMLGEMIGESLPSIKRVIGNRNPEPWELYSYHIFGPSKGRHFIKASHLSKTEEILPQKWIDANANLLKGKTVGQVRSIFKEKFED